MPIRRELRWLYPIDWPELSWSIRFGRGRGRCEACRRPHREVVRCLPDGRWLDQAAGPRGRWRDGRSRRCALPFPAELARSRTTRVVLAAAHLDHDPAHNHPRNLRSLCQRCHMLHDRPHHLAQRWLTYRRRWAIGDLFLGPALTFLAQAGPASASNHSCLATNGQPQCSFSSYTIDSGYRSALTLRKCTPPQITNQQDCRQSALRSMSPSLW